MKFDLKRGFPVVRFLRTVDQCAGEVLFESQGGDRLNLKSQLSKYLFLTFHPDDDALITGRVECSAEAAHQLAEFLVIPE